MPTLPDLADAVRGLVSLRVTGLSRTVDIAEVAFAGDLWLHAPCPFRVTRGETTWLGTVDMNYPATADADPVEAYRANATMFDKRARRITERFQAVEYVVESAHLGRAGAVTLELTGAVVIEVFPTCGGPVEQWRLFRRGSGIHHHYPGAAG
jgi:hypothetical protein